MTAVALASTQDVSRAVFNQFKHTGGAVNDQAAELASLQTLAYADRMGQVGERVGQTAPGPSGLDDAVQEMLARNARAAAQEVALTYNRDLGLFIDAQLAADPTLTQAELSREVRQWAGDRAAWKAPQVAETQTAAARHWADQDLVRRNDLTLAARVVSGSGDPCDDCQELIDQGSMDAAEAVALDLPVHPNCACSLHYSGSLAGAGDLWLGGDTGSIAAHDRFRLIALDWDESAHPRDERGRFTTGAGGGFGEADIGPWKSAGGIGLGGPKAQKNLAAWASAHGWTPEALANRTTSYMHEIAQKYPEDVAAGKAWYDTAHQIAHENAATYGVSFEQATAVMAALSPQTEWGLNVQQASQALDIARNGTDAQVTIGDAQVKRLDSLRNSDGTQPVPNAGQYRGENVPLSSLPLAGQLALTPGPLHNQNALNVQRVAEIISGSPTDPTLADRVLGGSKVRSFYNNIGDPHEPSKQYVTVDTHQIRAMTNEPAMPGDDAAKIMGNVNQYEMFAQAVREGTDRLQSEPQFTGITPNQVQAVMWTSWKNHAGAGEPSGQPVGHLTIAPAGKIAAADTGYSPVGRLLDPYTFTGVDPDGLTEAEVAANSTGDLVLLWDEAQHPRDEHGRFSSDGGAGGAESAVERGGHAGEPSMLASLKSSGGFTYNAVSGVAVTGQGCVFSPYESREKVIAARQATAADVHTFIRANQDLLAKPDHYVGGWFDPESSKTYLDVSVVVPTAAEAEQASITYHQAAYYDMASGQTVYVHARTDEKVAASEWRHAGRRFLGLFRG